MHPGLTLLCSLGCLLGDVLQGYRTSRREGKGALVMALVFFLPLPTPNWEEKVGGCKKMLNNRIIEKL